MITFDAFKQIDGVPIYQQILYYIKREIIAGNIVDGDELPSRRMLSARLCINPNTVQKAFHMLEEEHLIESKAGSKSYMTLNDKIIQQLKEDLLKEDIQRITFSLKQMGISKDEALNLIDKYWEVSHEK